VVAAADARPEGYANADLEILFLPLRHNGYAQARILGIMTAAAKPSWLGLLAVEQLTLRSLRAIDETAAPVERVCEPSQHLGASERRGHLRVFEGGK
jgi:hypothetical protein